MPKIRVARCGLLAIGLTGVAGCHSRGPDMGALARPFPGVRLVVGVVDEPRVLATVTPQLGEWTATRGGEVEVRGAPIDPESARGADLLLFRGDRLGDLIDARALAALPEAVGRPPAAVEAESEEAAAGDEPRPDRAAADPLRFADVVPAYRDQVARYGSERFALPLGGSALVLVYRRVAFERTANREAAGAEDLAWEPPATWDRFDALARFFQGRDWNGDGSPDFGVALALGPDAEGLGEATFLARAASLGQHRDQYSFLFDADTMAPRIDSPPFVEALTALTALTASGPPDLARFDAEAARRAFRRGDVALLIDRAERASLWGEGGGGAIDVVPLPGSCRVFDPLRGRWEDASPPNRPSYLPFGGGWLVGVASATEGRRREAAIDFATYLVGPEVAAHVRAGRAFVMLPVRSSLLGQGLPDPRVAPGVDARRWSEAVSRTLLAARVVPGPRIPGADGYLADLGRGRVAAVAGEPADRALREVARRWSERTRSLGTERQLWHYRRSLNTLVTTPEPPGR
ncbi:MAG: extracellular solute-binding protein [Planctomycetaceae bacterium]|nr:extracellular solute-binding protein [Planctomycetaceae bacterium]